MWRQRLDKFNLLVSICTSIVCIDIKKGEIKTSNIGEETIFGDMIGRPKLFFRVRLILDLKLIIPPCFLQIGKNMIK
jgi:hypothetical protein